MKLLQSRRPYVIDRLLAIIYASTFFIILILAYTGNLPPQLSQIPFYDKIGHVVLYSIATYLGHRVLSYRSIKVRAIAKQFPAPITIPMFPLLFGLFTLVEEGVQGFSPHRTLDAVDLIASFSGIALGYWFAEKRR